MRKTHTIQETVWLKFFLNELSFQDFVNFFSNQAPTRFKDLLSLFIIMIIYSDNQKTVIFVKKYGILYLH